MTQNDHLGKIFSTFWSYVNFSCLHSAVKLGVFEMIGQNHYTTVEIAKDLQINERPAHYLLTHLCNMDYLNRNNNKWSLTEVSHLYLLNDSKFSLVKFMDRCYRLQKAYENLSMIIETDRPDPNLQQETLCAFGQDETLTEMFASSMNSISYGMAEKVLKHIDLSTKSTLLDIGSGWGILSITLAKKWTTLRCDLFDFANVLNGAKKLIQEYDLGSRFNLIPGNWNKDLPSGKWDVVLLANALHEEKMKNAKKLFHHSIDLVSKDGFLLVVGFLDINDPIASIFSMNLQVELGSDNTTLDWLREEIKYTSIKEFKVVLLSGGKALWIGKKS